jgi:hypothetical protein
MNNSTFEKRLEKIEQRTLIDPVILCMGDGSQHSIRGDFKHFVRLRDAGLLDSNEANPLATEIGWLRSAIKIEEPGDGGLFHLLQTLLLPPNTEGQEDDPE